MTTMQNDDNDDNDDNDENGGKGTDGLVQSAEPKKKRKRKKRKRRKDFKNSIAAEDALPPGIDAQIALVISRLDQICSNQEDIIKRLGALERSSGASQHGDTTAAAAAIMQSQLEEDFAVHKERHRDIVHEVTTAIFSRR